MKMTGNPLRHLMLDLYRLVVAGHLPATVLFERVHRHLRRSCEGCLLEWTVFHEDTGRELPLPRLEPNDDLSPLAAADRHVSIRDLPRRVRRKKRRTQQRQRVERQMKAFIAASPGDRPTLIETSNGRFRSRAFAELLILKSRDLVSEDPVDAEDLASHVPLVLKWTAGATGTSWAAELSLRALAWKANAIRVQGDLLRAEKLLCGVLGSPLLRPVGNFALRAEIASLEASLRLEQRRFDAARQGLGRALALYQQVRHREGQLRVLLKWTNLHLIRGAAEEALESNRTAAGLAEQVALGAREALSLVHGRIAALCQLGRYDEAEQVLQSDWPRSSKSAGLSAPAHHHSLVARIAWGRGSYERAVTSFLEAQRVFLDTRHAYDAALVSLDLAQVYLESRRFRELQELASELVPQFQVQGVGREALAALGLLGSAVRAETLTVDLLHQVRRRLHSHRATFSSSLQRPGVDDRDATG